VRFKEKGNLFFFFKVKCSWKRWVFVESFECCQGFCILYEGGQIIPPAWYCEWECSGEWFWGCLWWYYKPYEYVHSFFIYIMYGFMLNEYFFVFKCFCSC